MPLCTNRLFPLPSASSIPALQKENFLDSLDKRRALIKADVDADKSSLAALKAHTAALNARVSRLRKERLAQELQAQTNQYVAAGKKLASEVATIDKVTSALKARVSSLDSEVQPLAQQEYELIATSLSGGKGKNAEEAKKEEAKKEEKKKL